MMTRAFRELEVGDRFQLDGRLYQKRAAYSARLVRDSNGKRPSIQINRMIDPEAEVEIEASDVIRIADTNE